MKFLLVFLPTMKLIQVQTYRDVVGSAAGLEGAHGQMSPMLECCG